MCTIQPSMATRGGHWQTGMLGLMAWTAAALLALVAVYWWRPLALLDAYAAWSRWRAGLETRAITLGHDRWVYDEREAARGDATDTLVLVHGFAGSRADWYPLLPYLPRSGRLVVVDLPGWGASRRDPHADYRARAQARRLAHFLDAIEATRVHLVGHSMGGKISGIAAAWHPARITALTLVAPSGLHYTENEFTRRVLAGEDPFKLRDHADYARLLHDGFERPPPLPRHLEDALVQANQQDHAFYDHMLDVLRRGEHRYALEPALGRLRMPVQIVWCRKDRILDVSSTATVQRLLPQARIDIIDEGCGHMPMMEVPEILARLLHAVPAP